MIVAQDIEIYGVADEMSDEEFFKFCMKNRDLGIERDPDGKIIIMLTQ